MIFLVEIVNLLLHLCRGQQTALTARVFNQCLGVWDSGRHSLLNVHPFPQTFILIKKHLKRHTAKRKSSNKWNSMMRRAKIYKVLNSFSFFCQNVGKRQRQGNSRVTESPRSLNCSGYEPEDMLLIRKLKLFYGHSSEILEFHKHSITKTTRLHEIYVEIT